jgi:glycosyltransferase involved in cell wall biosynthesis
MKRVLIFIVCYNAEHFIEQVLDRIPKEIWDSEAFYTEILVIDDESADQTFYKANDYASRYQKSNLTVLYNPKNQGYGGNQKIGYHYTIQNRFDVVVLLHGDGQYAPEYLGQMIGPILVGEADVVLGSRMIRKRDALRGKMPLYKWGGNQILTFIQNRLLGSRLSEFHTGYRAYSVPALASIPFMYNSDYFDFDTDIVIQLLDTKKRIKEIPIPTFYGDEISRVDGVKYAASILLSTIHSRIVKWGIFYHPKFDYRTANSVYTAKFGFPSSHQFALDRVRPGSNVLDVGCGPGFMALELSKKQVRTISLDQYIQPDVKKYSIKTIQVDLDEYDFSSDSTKIDFVLALDIIEHLRSPETFLRRLRDRYSWDCPEVIITTGNVAFFIIRLGLLLGQFNYGGRGILDLDHVRLFTFSSLRRTLILNGYDILEERGIPAPFPLVWRDGWLSRLLLRINGLLISLSKSFFSYQIAFVAKPRPTLDHLLQDAQQARDEKLKQLRLPASVS